MVYYCYCYYYSQVFSGEDLALAPPQFIHGVVTFQLHPNGVGGHWHLPPAGFVDACAEGQSRQDAAVGRNVHSNPLGLHERRRPPATITCVFMVFMVFMLCARARVCVCVFFFFLSFFHQCRF